MKNRLLPDIYKGALILLAVWGSSAPCWSGDLEYRILLHSEHMIYSDKAPPKHDELWLELLSSDGKLKLLAQSQPDGPIKSELEYDGTNVFTLSHGAGGVRSIGGETKRFEEAGSVQKATTESFIGNLGAIWWVYFIPREISNDEGYIRDFMWFLGPTRQVQLYYRFTPGGSDTRIGATTCSLYLDKPIATNAPPLAVLEITRIIITNGVTIVAGANIMRCNQIARDDNGNPLPLETYSISSSRITCTAPTISSAPVLSRNTLITDRRPSPSAAYEHVASDWFGERELSKGVTPNRIGVFVICAILAAGGIMIFLSSTRKRNADKPQQ